MKVCVFCGSNPGRSLTYRTLARDVASGLARAGHAIVYGGSSVGLMGLLANAAMAAGGRVVGVIPKALADAELAHDGLSELVVVGTMHERKAAMAARSDAFFVLPGGIGTLEELFEMWTWTQLGIHAKPIVLLDRTGFYDSLLAFLDHQVEEGFLKPVHRALLTRTGSVEHALRIVAEFRHVAVSKLEADARVAAAAPC